MEEDNVYTMYVHVYTYTWSISVFDIVWGLPSSEDYEALFSGEKNPSINMSSHSRLGITCFGPVISW